MDDVANVTPASGRRPLRLPKVACGSPRASWRLTLGSVGVVYGDIGTSPLYAFRERRWPQRSRPVTRDTVLGVLSLILWALIIVVTIKYVLSCCAPTTTARAARSR